jgi:putative toxin-antitoxin system antitoxin component (TIGR02293 family)
MPKARHISRTTVAVKELPPKAEQKSNASKTLNYLGSKTEVANETDFIDIIRNGLNRKALDRLMLLTGLSASEIASFIHVSDRTLRRYKPSTILNPEQSERVLEIAHLYTRGEEVFGDMEAFKEWVDSELMALGNKKPKAFLDTSRGVLMVDAILGRIEHGVFS